jgi:hypothetical protein
MRVEAFGIAAADRASVRFSWNRIGPETVRAYERLLPVALAVPGEADGADDEVMADSDAEVYALRVPA